ncbi:MAG: hypothetical protein AABW59_01120 [archaeon]
MQNNEMLKWFGLFIVAVMALSMLAAGLLYRENDTSGADVDAANILANQNQATFNYTITFDTNALKELNALRFAAKTSLTDKQTIDDAVLKVSGVSKISSKFVKQPNETDWYYFAEVSLKRDSDSSLISSEISKLEVFTSDASSFEAMKYMTISSPGKVSIHNTDLNVDRDFNFEISTLSSIVSLETIPNDNITVSGTMTLSGNAIQSLDLLEKLNNTSSPKQFSASGNFTIVSVENELTLDAEKDSNVFDENYLRAEITKLDSNAQMYFDSSSGAKASILFTTDSAVASLEKLFTDANFSVTTARTANFDENYFTVPEIGLDLKYPQGTFTASVSPSKKAGDEVLLNINGYYSRDSILFISAEEKN